MHGSCRCHDWKAAEHCLRLQEAMKLSESQKQRILELRSNLFERILSLLDKRRVILRHLEVSPFSHCKLSCRWLDVAGLQDHADQEGGWWEQPCLYLIRDASKQACKPLFSKSSCSAPSTDVGRRNPPAHVGCLCTASTVQLQMVFTFGAGVHAKGHNQHEVPGLRPQGELPQGLSWPAMLCGSAWRALATLREGHLTESTMLAMPVSRMCCPIISQDSMP